MSMPAYDHGRFAANAARNSAAEAPQEQQHSQPPRHDGDMAAGQGLDAQARAAEALYQRIRASLWNRAEDYAPLEACLCSLILAIEPTIPLARVVEAMPPGRSRLHLTDVANVMSNIGYAARPGTLAPRDLDPRLLPCLFTGTRRADGEPAAPVVVTAVRERPEGSILAVFNGATGRMEEWHPDEPRARKAGHAIFFQHAEPEEDPTSHASRATTGHGWFSATLSRFRASFWHLAAVSFTMSLVGLATPLFIMLVYDRVIAPRALEPLAFLSLGVLLAIGMEWVLRSLRSVSLSWLAARLDYMVGTSIFDRLIQLPPAYIERASVSAQVARVKTFESVREFFSGPVFMTVLELPSILISLAAIAWFGGSLVIVPVVIAVLYTAIFFVVRRQVAVAMRQAAKATSVAQQFTIETFEKLEAVRGNGLSTVWMSKFAELSGRENLANFRLMFLGNVGESLAHSLTVLAGVSTLAYGVHLIWAGSISPGVLVASMILIWRVLTPFYSLCTMIPRFEQLRNAAIQINQLMDVRTESESDEISARLPEIKGRVTFSNVGLRYDRVAGPVFLGLNADIRPGEIIAVTGANGTGKSSVLKLVQGLYAPITGSVRIDGFDIRQLVQRDLRRAIAYVPQSPDLLAGTIADNLRHSRPLASDKDLWHMLDVVGALEEVQALTRGLDTQVEYGREARISASLRYRLVLARAMLSDSHLLLIDEQPNAVLNAGLGDVLRRVLEESRGKRTVLFVSHRVDLLRHADRVIRLQHGQAPACGPLDQILEAVE